MNRKYYVYLHRRGDGRVVYVGKGTGSRAWHDSNRTHHLHKRWMSFLLNKGCTEFCEVISWHLTEEDALAEEKHLIEHYENLGDKLFNNHFSRHRGIERN